MARNLVVCCDGTSNEFSQSRTNVAKLCYTLGQDEEAQLVFYHPGLGTMEPPGALTTVAIRITKCLGLAVGYGLERDIRDAYVYLMNAYKPGDRVFIFGFSRGAYTARALTALLHMYGLMRQGNEPLVPYAIRMMTAINNLPDHRGARQVSAKQEQAAHEIFALADTFKKTFSVECKPHFVGLWDTVSSVGLLSHPFRAPYTANNPDIQVARHALALDERRGFFRPSPWFPHQPPGPKSGPRDLVQVWFPGDHSDVGGGYPEAESGLAKGALRWMICEAQKHQLLFDDARLKQMFGIGPSEYIPPNPNATLHDSLTWKWKLAEFLPKRVYDARTKTWPWRVNFFRKRDIPENALVHESAFARGEAYRKRLPKRAVMVKTACDPALGI